MGQKVLVKSRLAEIEDEAPDIKRLRLVPTKRATFPAFAPGAFAILQLPGGLRRPYSLCSDAADPTSWEFCVLREAAGQGGSTYIHDMLRQGDELFVTHPQSHFSLADRAERHVFVAGGIGVTPFAPMALEAARRGQPATLHYCAGSAERAALLGRLRAVPGLDLTLWFGPGRRLDLAALLAAPEPGVHIYCCGPARMLAAFEAATAGWPAAQVHMERFQGVSPDPLPGDRAFEAELATSGRLVPIAANETLLHALRAAGVPVDHACENGVCGSCRVEVLDGAPIHRDLCLSPAERARHVITCVSRAKGRLRLAL